MTPDQFQDARSRGDARMRGPLAERAHYDAGRGRLIVRLVNGPEWSLRFGARKRTPGGAKARL